MKKWIRKLLVVLRRQTYHSAVSHYNSVLDPSSQDKIRDLLLSSNSCMIARFGSVELQSVVDYLYPAECSNIALFLQGKIPSWGYAPSTIHTMHINAGFFPPTESMLNRFGQLMIDCMKEVDLLGSWRPEEEHVMKYMPKVKRVPLPNLEPYYFDNPWAIALEGKRVLVIHPFEDTIRKQHAQLDKLFADKQMTPN